MRGSGSSGCASTPSTRPAPWSCASSVCARRTMRTRGMRRPELASDAAVQDSGLPCGRQRNSTMRGGQISRLLDRLATPTLLLALAVLAAHALTTVYAYFSRDNHGWWWSDGHYNLLRAFYLANGLTLYSDIVSNHFPGFQVLYSIPLRLLGYGSAVPSNELLPTLEKVGMFITGTLQIVLLMWAGRRVRLPASLATALSIFTTYYLWEGFGYYFPLVETVLVFVMPITVVLLHAVVFSEDAGDAVDAAVGLVCLSVLLDVLGLTVAPTALLWTAAALPLLIV